jgi:UDP-glucose:(heptosyl)LPS alpha-1,3-glucosyltransferase
MHVGILCEHSDPARGGAERYLQALAARFALHGHTVSIRARTGPHAVPVRAFPASTRPRRYGTVLLLGLRAAGAERVLATVPVPGCDFYQPHHGIYGAAIPAHLDALPWGVRHLRGWNPVRALHFARLRRFEEEVVRSHARVLALSPRIVADLQRFYPGIEPLLRRPGVDLARFTPDGSRDETPLLLFVASNFRLKGLRTALRALRALRRLPAARLVVVGEDRPITTERVEYRRRADDLPDLYRRAHALVHPTWYDTAATVVLEALASGTPPITTTRDGNADLAGEGGGVVLEDPGDAESLAQAIERLPAQPEADRARAVAERFSAEAMLDAVVETVCNSSS